MKKKRLEIFSFLKTLKCVKPPKNVNFETILKGINSDILYGFLFVDIYTSDELIPKFADFCMITKNAMISLENLSKSIKSYY